MCAPGSGVTRATPMRDRQVERILAVAEVPSRCTRPRSARAVEDLQHAAERRSAGLVEGDARFERGRAGQDVIDRHTRAARIRDAVAVRVLLSRVRGRRAVVARIADPSASRSSWPDWRPVGSCPGGHTSHRRRIGAPGQASQASPTPSPITVGLLRVGYGRAVVARVPDASPSLSS